MKRTRFEFGDLVKFEFDRFGWDPLKAAANSRKHGVNFEVAQAIFDKMVLAVAEDENGEERWFAIGEIDGAEYAIAFAEFGNRCRVISFRRATRSERLEYRVVYARGTA